MEKISKEGVVSFVGEKTVLVRFSSCSACEGCHAKSFCFEKKQKDIEVETDEASSFYVGEKVLLTLTGRAGLSAVFLGYVLPLVLMLGILFATSAFGYDDFICGISAIIVLIPYYFGLFLSRKRFGNAFFVKIDHFHTS